MYDEIVGHDVVKKVFSTPPRSHSFIFEGKESIGKFALAQKIADEYGKIKQNIHIINDDKISVDDVRQICNDLQQFPYMGQKRVVIVNNADRLNDVSQNAMLKTLEDPPDYCYIFLICEDSNKLLETIRSRCSIIKMVGMNREQIYTEISALDMNDDLKQFISVCIDGKLGRWYDANKEDDYQYYINLHDIAKKLDGSTKSKDVLSIVNLMDVKTPNSLKRQLVDLSCWFRYMYFESVELKFMMYVRIINDIISKLDTSNNAVLCAELLVIRIIKHNEVIAKKDKEGGSVGSKR